MKSVKAILMITGMLIAVCATPVSAQTRPHKTSSAKAYYGSTPTKQKMKKKQKQKVDWDVHKKPAKGTRAHAWDTKKKYQRS